MRKKRSHRPTKLALGLAALALAASAGGVSDAAKLAGNIVAVPGSAAAGYATRTIVILKGSQTTFRNLDIQLHDVVSVSGLFSSALIGLGKSAKVNGTAALAKGTYAFFCSIHPRSMKGSIIVR